MSLNKKQAIALGLALCLKKKKRPSKKWTNEWLLRRHSTSHTNLMSELRCEPDDWRNYMRMDENTYMALLELVTPLIQREDTNMRKAITPHERLNSTLRFLATGRSLNDLRYSVRIGTSTLSDIIPETCEAIYEVLKMEFLKFPDSEEWMKIGQQFEDKWDFPNCIGAVDGKHVRIVPPKDSGSYYWNYKGYNSLILMAVVNANYEFILADFGTNGGVSDGGVLNNIQFGKRLLDNKFSIPNIGNRDLPCVFVGDEAFALQPDFMIPFPQKELNENTRIFNYRHSRALRVVESAFGILATRFRIYHTAINLKLKSIEKVVLATIVLHNYLRRRSPDILTPEENFTAEGSPSEIRKNSACMSSLEKGKGERFYPQMAKDVREKYMQYFLSKEGEIE